MSTTIVVPALGESITEAIVASWLKQPGEAVAADEPIAELETDKITIEVPAPANGVLSEHLVEEGATVEVGQSLAKFDEGAAAAQATGTESSSPASTGSSSSTESSQSDTPATPTARAEARRSGVDIGSVDGSGRGGRVVKEDVQRAAANTASPPAAPPAAAPTAKTSSAPSVNRPATGEAETRVKFTPLRRRIAERLIEAQQTAAILTTFNEVDMSAVKALRAEYQDRFVKKYGIKLGFMSFFVKAAVDALREYPAINAELGADEIIYKNYYDIGVAVGGGKGLVVPVIRGADQLGFADIEQEIVRLAGLAKSNKLQLSDLTGGTFTISNGGIYGSMLSTPILNPPQTGILGLHNIVERPVAVNGQIEIRPIMYLALSYDHRLVDGREAVQFLVRIKEAIEDPRRLLLDV